MAKAAGVSLTSVQRIWRAHGLAPHRIRTFKLSNDPKFAVKVRDIVGPYVDPPALAVGRTSPPASPCSRANPQSSDLQS